MTETIPLEAAQAALKAHDWMTAQLYWVQLERQNELAANQWLHEIEAAARPVAESGEKFAQSVLGFVFSLRADKSPSTYTDDLGAAIRWYMAAARHEGADIMIGVVDHWYALSDVQDAEVEAFLAEPGIRERYRRFREEQGG